MSVADDLKLAYEMKVHDLARETERSTVLAALVRRLYYAWVSANRFVPQEWVEDFFKEGFPGTEFEALIDAVRAESPSSADLLRSLRRPPEIEDTGPSASGETE